MEPMEVVPAVVTVALPGLLLAGSVLNLVLVGREADTTGARVARYAVPPLAMGFASAAFAIGAGPAITAPASLAALLALEAWAIAFATPPSLTDLAESAAGGGSPGWWSGFKRDFRNPFRVRSRTHSARPLTARRRDRPARSGARSISQRCPRAARRTGRRTGSARRRGGWLWRRHRRRGRVLGHRLERDQEAVRLRDAT